MEGDMNNLNNNNFANNNNQGQIESMDCDEYKINQIPSQFRNPSEAWNDLNKVMKGGFQIAADAANSIKENMNNKFIFTDKRVQEQFQYIWKCAEEEAARNRACQENLARTTEFLYSEIISRTNCYNQIFSQITDRLNEFNAFSNNSVNIFNKHSIENLEMSDEIKNMKRTQLNMNETLEKINLNANITYEKAIGLETKIGNINDSMKSLETMCHQISGRYNADSETIKNMINNRLESNYNKLREEMELTKVRAKSIEKSSASVKKEIIPGKPEQSLNKEKIKISSENDKLINKINNNKKIINNFVNEKLSNVSKPESICIEQESIKDKMIPIYNKNLLMKGKIDKEPRKLCSSLSKEKNIIDPDIYKIDGDDDDNCFYEDEEEAFKPLLIPNKLNPFSSNAYRYLCRPEEGDEIDYEETFFFIDRKHKQKSIIFLDIKRSEINGDNINGVVEKLKWLLERKYDMNEIYFQIAEGDEEDLQSYMENYIETLETSYKLENYTPKMKKKIKEKDFIYQIQLKEDRITFKSYPNNEEKRKMLGTFFLENFRKSFDFINYTIIAKDIEDKEEAIKKKLEESKKKTLDEEEKRKAKSKEIEIARNSSSKRNQIGNYAYGTNPYYGGRRINENSYGYRGNYDNGNGYRPPYQNGGYRGSYYNNRGGNNYTRGGRGNRGGRNTSREEIDELKKTIKVLTNSSKN